MAAQHLSREKHKASLIISRLSTAGGWHFSSLRAANHAERKKETVRSCCLLYATALFCPLLIIKPISVVPALRTVKRT